MITHLFCPALEEGNQQQPKDLHVSSDVPSGPQSLKLTALVSSGHTGAKEVTSGVNEAVVLEVVGDELPTKHHLLYE